MSSSRIMLRHSFILCFVFALPSICTDDNDIKNSSSTLSVGFSNDRRINQSKITLPVEGGMQISETPAHLDNKTHDLFLINEEQGNEKVGSIHARKGVPLNDSKEVEPPDVPLKESKLLPVILKSNDTSASYNSSNKLPLNSYMNKSGSDTADKTSSTEHIKKPIILSYEALSNADVNIKKETSSHNPKTSSKPVEYNQLPSPQSSIHIGAKNKRPEMIIPIVITILVLPVLAFLGYMGLKKGREAWKNRHYKRMDFLLDGMYND